MRHRVAMIGLALLGLSLVACASDASVRVRVIDDAGVPVVGSEVRVVYGAGPINKGVGQQTQADGTAELQYASSECLISVFARHPNHYSSVRLDYLFSGINPLTNTWRPWNAEIGVQLVRKRHPVPMAARHLKVMVPEEAKRGTAIGFDLLISDWVRPYGQGEVADLVIRTEDRYPENRQYNHPPRDTRCILSFSNPDDGIQLQVVKPGPGGTSFRSDFLAPETGYQPQVQRRQAKYAFDQRPAEYDPSAPLIDGEGWLRRSFDDEPYLYANRMDSTQHPFWCWYIRVRSRRLPDGRITGLYGKIYGQVAMSIGSETKNAYLELMYYLNPDGTRNVEFDPSRNLLQGRIPEQELAREP